MGRNWLWMTDEELARLAGGNCLAPTTRMALELQARRKLHPEEASGVHPAGEIEQKTELDESSILGAAPLVIEFLLTAASAAAICSDGGKPAAGDKIRLRIIIRWGWGAKAFYLGADELGEQVWKSTEGWTGSLGGLYLCTENVIVIGLRLLSSRGFRATTSRIPTPNGGVIIDLGTV